MSEATSKVAEAEIDFHFFHHSVYKLELHLYNNLFSQLIWFSSFLNLFLRSIRSISQIIFPSGVLPSYGGCWTRLCPICQAWLVFFYIFVYLFSFILYLYSHIFCFCVLCKFVFVFFCNSYFRFLGQELKPKPRSEGSRAVVVRLVCRLEN